MSTGSPGLQKFRRSLGEVLVTRPAGLLARTGVSPDLLTLMGLILAAVVAWVLSQGHFFLGGFLVLVSGAFDLLDGAVARALGRTRKSGALLDSTFDRFSEGVLFLGLLVYFAGQGAYAEVILIAAALIGALATSYVKARAESLGLECDVGVFTRPERVILLAIGLIFNQMLIILWIIAVVANLIAWQRLIHVWLRARRAEAGDD